MLKSRGAHTIRRTLLLSICGAIFAGCFFAGNAAHAQSMPWRNWGNDPSRILTVEAGGNWQSHAERRDSDRINNLNEAWDQALASARQDGHGGAIRAEGVLLDPRAGKPGAHPPGGFYRCRTFKLGTRQPGLLAFVSYPAFRCRFWESFGITYFEKINGSQRTAGVVFRDGSIRSVMLGTEAWGEEKGFPRYSEDGERDQIAVVERIGEGRWRLVFPFPARESLLNVIELIDQEHVEQRN